MEFKKKCPSCEKEIIYSSAQTLYTSIKLNKSCRSCSKTKPGYNESLTVQCRNCGKERTYSNKYNAHTARTKGSCSSCSRSKANETLWKDEEFKKRRSKATTERWHEFWSDPKKREELGVRTSLRNIEMWKDDAYRDQMIPTLMNNQKNYGKQGYFKGFHFRSTKELKFMLQLDREGKVWQSCENSEYAIRYEYKDSVHTYYPDFRVGDEIFEIKPKSRFEDEIVQAKKAAAEIWCSERGLSYRLHDPGSISSQEFDMLVEREVISRQCE